MRSSRLREAGWVFSVSQRESFACENVPLTSELMLRHGKKSGKVKTLTLVLVSNQGPTWPWMPL